MLRWGEQEGAKPRADVKSFVILIKMWGLLETNFLALRNTKD